MKRVRFGYDGRSGRQCRGHAGDWVCVDLLDALMARADRLIGVVGNNDGPPLSAQLPEIATAQLDGMRLA